MVVAVYLPKMGLGKNFMEWSGVSDLFLMWPEKVELAAERKTRHVFLAPYDIFHVSSKHTMYSIQECLARTQ